MFAPRLALAGVLIALAQIGCLPEEGGRPGLSAYNLEDEGLALHGYSPVSYREKGAAEPGSPRWAATHRGITYHLADPEQQTAFAADPDRYEPAFGGWCAYGISLGIRWDADPTAFKVVGERLLLFSRAGDADARELWEREPDERALLARADHYWKSLLAD